MDTFAQLEAQMEGQPQGVVYQSKANASRNYNMTIWAKSWAEVIEQCSARLRFFRERLNYNASQSSGKKFLIDTYPKFIPKFEKDENDTAGEVNTEVPPAPTPPTARTPHTSRRRKR
jgi:hypothetical protein